jgi:hypothetical protein
MSSLLQQVLSEIDQLAPMEQMRVMEYLVGRMKQHVVSEEVPKKQKRKLSEFRGIAKYPLLGEDAQAWVSRTRREGDEHREQSLRGDA